MKEIKVNGKLCPVYSDEYTILPVNRDKAAMVNVNNIMSLNIGQWRNEDMEKTIDQFLIRMAAYEPTISTIYVFFGGLYKSKNSDVEEYYGRFTTPQSLIVQKEGNVFPTDRIAAALIGLIKDREPKEFGKVGKMIYEDGITLSLDWFQVLGDICIVFGDASLPKYLRSWEHIEVPKLTKTPPAPSGVVYAPYLLSKNCPTLSNIITIDSKYISDDPAQMERYARCFQVN